MLKAEIAIAIDACRRVYDEDSTITDDESRVRRAVGHRCPDIRTDLPQRKQRLGNTLSVGLTAQTNKTKHTSCSSRMAPLAVCVTHTRPAGMTDRPIDLDSGAPSRRPLKHSEGDGRRGAL